MCPNVPGTEQGEMDVHTQSKEQEIFPTWLILLLSSCAQKHTRAGSRLVRGGREVWQGWMFHQYLVISAPSLTLTSWGSRQWLLVPFPETSVSWNGIFPPQPTQN